MRQVGGSMIHRLLDRFLIFRGNFSRRKLLMRNLFLLRLARGRKTHQVGKLINISEKRDVYSPAISLTLSAILEEVSPCFSKSSSAGPIPQKVSLNPIILMGTGFS